jgi:hypothetical protein
MDIKEHVQALSIVDGVGTLVKNIWKTCRGQWAISK